MIKDHLLDLNLTERQPGLIQHRGRQYHATIPNELPHARTTGLPEPSHLMATEAASQLLAFLEARPSHPAHQAILIASGSSQEELRDECVIIELDMIQLMDYSTALAEAVICCTGEITSLFAISRNNSVWLITGPSVASKG